MNWRRYAAATPEVVVVTTVNDTSIRGLLVERGERWLTLKAAQLEGHDTNGNLRWTPLEGDVLVPNEQVAFIQSGLDAAILGRA